MNRREMVLLVVRLLSKLNLCLVNIKKKKSILAWTSSNICARPKNWWFSQEKKRTGSCAETWFYRGHKWPSGPRDNGERDAERDNDIITALNCYQTTSELVDTDRHKHTSMSLSESPYILSGHTHTHTQLTVDRLWEGEIKANKRGKGFRVKW